MPGLTVNNNQPLFSEEVKQCMSAVYFSLFGHLKVVVFHSCEGNSTFCIEVGIAPQVILLHFHLHSHCLNIFHSLLSFFSSLLKRMVEGTVNA